MNPATAIEVVCAVIRREGRVLLAKRPAGKRLGGLWEFPGGKVEPGELPAEALRREIREELACDVRVRQALESCAHEYEWGGIVLLPFICEMDAGSPEPLPHEHEEIAWVRAGEIADYELAPADVPVARMLEGMIS